MKLYDIFTEVADRHHVDREAMIREARGPHDQLEARREAVYRAVMAGIPYPEIATATGARVHNLYVLVSQHRKRHRKPRYWNIGSKPMPVEVHGVCWFSIVDCANHYGVSRGSVEYRIQTGTLDRLGGQRRGGHGPSKALRLGLFVFESKKDACAFLGYSRPQLQRRLTLNKADELRAALRLAEEKYPIKSAEFRNLAKIAKYRTLHDHLLDDMKGPTGSNPAQGSQP